jgi:TolB-like protein/Tfp pilus assembly protein PilF
VVRDAVPVGVEEAVAKALAKVPADRFVTALQFAEALELGSEQPAPVSPTAHPWPRRRVLSAAATALVALIAVWWGVSRLVGRSVRIDSLAVLPLKNLITDPEQEYFVEGMQEALTTELSRISALRVISRTSTARYRDTDKPMPQIARELGVEGLIEGSVLRDGDQVRVTVQLIHGPSDRHLWADSYQRELRGILALQGEIAGAVAREIEIALTPAEATRMAHTPLVNPEAHEAYLRGQFYRLQWSESALELARNYFQQAIQLDPNYAPPYVGLAQTYIWGPLPRDTTAKAEPLVRRALELDSTLAEAHAVLAAIKFRNELDWLGAAAEFRRALQFNPSNADAHHMYSHLLLALGRNQESLAESRRALSLDVRSPAMTTHMGTHYIATRQYDQAIEQMRRALALDPNFAEAHLQLGWALLGKGAYEEASAALETGLMLGWEASKVSLLAFAYARTGRASEGQQKLRELKERAGVRYVSPYDLAFAHMGLGQNDQCFEWLEKAYEQRDGALTQLRWDALWDPLRDDPRFQDLVRRMNFPQ